MSNLSREELSALRDHLAQNFKKAVKDLGLSSRDDFRRILQADLEDGDTLIIHMAAPGIPPSMLESEVATLDYLREKTSIKVPRILQTHYSGGENVRPYVALEKIRGSALEKVWGDLENFQQDLIIGQIARWMMELFKHHFERIGSLYPVKDKPGEVHVGPIIQPLFYVNGRSEYRLDRGPFSSAKDYLSGCVARELDCTRLMFSQDTSKEYQERYQEEKMNVERSMNLFEELIQRCPGLDEGDAELASFSLDIHKIGLKDFIVNPEDHSHVISVEFAPLSTQPLWCCAQMPSWMSPSMSGPEEEERKERWATIFRSTVISVEGYHSLFLRSLESDDIRHALLDVCRFNAFTDSFLIMPTLESIVATLPGGEDLEGLEALLDPSTLEGRVARISLLTRGPGAMALAMPMNRSNLIDVASVVTLGGSNTEYARIDPSHFGSPLKSEKLSFPPSKETNVSHLTYLDLPEIVSEKDLNADNGNPTLITRD